MGTVVPVEVALPDKVAPHCSFDGVEIESVRDDGVRTVTAFDESVAEPLAEAVNELGVKPDNGPTPTGHTACTLGLMHNSGASPTACTAAVAEVRDPEVMVKSTRNDGVVPVTTGSRVERLSAVPGVRGTFCQPTIDDPSDARTDKTAEKFADGAGLVNVNDFHARTGVEAAEHAIRGTTARPGNDARVGAIEEQPVTLVTMLYERRFGCSCRVTHMQSGIAGSGVTL
jgi:hypothetical protein